MIAHCLVCGHDLPYEGECELCEARRELAQLRTRVRELERHEQAAGAALHYKEGACTCPMSLRELGEHSNACPLGHGLPDLPTDSHDEDERKAIDDPT